MTNTSDNSLGCKIFLIGFMGSGKSHWGNIWARRYAMDFYDLDEVIVARAGKTIAAIFEKEGEGYFRQLETEALLGFADKENCIVACGGGAACFNDNLDWMNEQGTTIYLSATPQFIFDHVIGEKNKRPLIKQLNEAELLFFIEQKLKEREMFYSQAQYILPVNELSDNSLSHLSLPKPLNL